MSERLDYVDGLRGVAICGVLITHAGGEIPGLPGVLERFAHYGARGVHLFFIVSAFTLATTTLSKPFDARAFYIKRFFRVAPMFYLAAVFYLLFNGVGPQRFAPAGISSMDVLLTFTFLHGLTPTSINSVVPGGWSIAAEAFFYLSLPFILIWANNLRRSIVALLISIGISLASVFLIKAILRNYQPYELVDTFARFTFVVNLPAFIFGITAYHFLRANLVNQISRRLAWVAFYSVLLLIVVVSTSKSRILLHPVLADLLLSSLLILVSITRARIIDNRIVRYMGTISFSMYLTHFAILSVVAPHVRLLGVGPVATFLALFLCTILLSAVASTFSYRYVEFPMIQLAKKLASKLPAGAVGVAG